MPQTKTKTQLEQNMEFIGLSASQCAKCGGKLWGNEWHTYDNGYVFHTKCYLNDTTSEA